MRKMRRILSPGQTKEPLPSEKGSDSTSAFVTALKDNIYILNQTSVSIVWLLFALMWGYAGWLVCAAYLPSIVHFLCAVLGFVGYPATYVIVSAIDEREQVIREKEH